MEGEIRLLDKYGVEDIEDRLDLFEFSILGFGENRYVIFICAEVCVIFYAWEVFCILLIYLI